MVYQHHIAYVKSAWFGEWVRITSRIVHYDKDTIIIEFYMTDDEKTHLKTVLWTIMKYIHVDTFKKIPHQPEVLDFLEKIVLPNFDIRKQPFDSRVKAIKEEIKNNSLKEE